MDSRYNSQTVDHTNTDFSQFAIVKAVIQQIQGEASKNPAGIFKTQAMLCDVLQVLVVVPLKVHCWPIRSS